LIFTETNLKDSYFIEPERIIDERGFFARSFDQKIFSNLGFANNFVQCNISFNKKKGTLRGLHFQEKPNSESKLVRCTKGKVFEVLVDIRPDSSTYRKWVSVILSSENRKMIFVPDGFALGFQTLEDDTELFYQMSQYYEPNSSRGIIWNDPCLKIPWPLNPTIISKKDQTLPLLS
jgi:dTDP-4-dehydrorhamnose 3,5-epimerase|tara:strand:- start:269 stop:796 length:528 start_codon:yes stop_codon:yes gene_type:complete